MHLTSKPMNSFTKGFSVTFSFRFNPSSSNPLVKMLSSVLSGSFIISFAMDEKQVSFSLMLPDVKLSDSCTMKQLRMFMNMALDVSDVPKLKFGLSVTFVTIVSGETLSFDGSVYVNVADQSVNIKIAMIGLWKGAFGIKKLSIGNIAGEIGLTATPPWLYLLALGGQVNIGDPKDPKPIVGKVYFKINLHDPNQNYFYGSLSKLTIQDIWGI